MDPASDAAPAGARDGRDSAAPQAIVFAHANGFPAGTYRRLFERWRAAGYRVLAPERLGHEPRHPVTANWPHLADELIEFAERGLDAPAWFVGHSLGGFLGVLAALRRPALVRGLVLLDSPIVGGWKAGALRVAQWTGLVRRYPFSAAARRRREQWPDAQAVRAHFAGKPAFERWHPQVLHDYVEAGTEAHEGGQRRLAFRREIEAAIYDTLPHHLARSLRRRPLACPLAFVGGRDSAEVRWIGLAATARAAGGRLRWIEGGHLFPMERPDETADEVLALLRTFEAGGDAASARRDCGR